MASARQKILFTFLLLFSILLGAFCFFNRERISFPVQKTVALDSPYLVRDCGNARYILDKQRTRIVAVDKATNETLLVLPQDDDDADRFYYADDFMVGEDGSVYVKEGAWNGNRISREAVLLYDKDGCYVSTFLDTHYTEIVNKHKMMLLSVEGKTLHFAVKNSDSVIIGSFDTEAEAKTQRKIAFENAFDFVSDMTRDEAGNIYLLDKAGRLFVLDGQNKDEFGLLCKFSADDYPNWIEPSLPGRLLYADLYADSVMELDAQNGTKRPVIENCGSVTVAPAPFSSLANPVKNAPMLWKESAIFAVFVLFLFCALSSAVFAAYLFASSGMKPIRRISIYVVIIVMAVAGTITYRLTAEFSKVMRAQILAQMENLAYAVSNSIRPATLDAIDSAEDFASEEYRQMILSMKSVIDPGLDVNRDVYCDVFKYDQKRGAYACAYLDQAIGTFFPVTASEAEEIKEIYKTGRAVTSSKDDSSASYTYVSVPVMNDNGEVRGVVSVMTENFMLAGQINSMKRNVLVGLVVTLIFVWLAMGEALSYILSRSQSELDAQERKLRGEPEEKAFPYYYIRLMVFALFAAYNMTTTFLPMVIAKGAFESLGQKGGAFAAALPISVNLFIIGLMALFCEGFIRHAGCKTTIVLGAALSAASNLLVFAFPFSYALLFFALVIDGIGVGFTTNSMYLMVSQIPDARNRTQGYAAYNAAQISGINFGMLFGAALALNVGRRLIFPLVALMWIVCALLFLALWKSLGIDGGKNAPPAAEERRNLKKTLLFLRHKKIWSFILCVQAPFALMGSFVYYYLPLYSEANGLSEVVVAVLMMLYSMFAIYLGNGLTKLVMQRTGPLSPYASIILSVVAVLVYAEAQSVPGLLTAIFILGLANGFGRSVQQAQFSMLDECEKYGIPNAMGIFNFTDFIGQSFGPAVMGLVFLSRNMLFSAVVFAAALVFVCVVHIALNATPKKINSGE